MRKYRLIWLALIPLGAVGALATGMMPMPWQASEKPIAKAPAANSEEPVKLAAVRPASPATLSDNAPAAASKKPAFGIDIARINGDGSSVIAGYATPGLTITIMADGQPIGVVKPDSNGEWVLVTTHKFADLEPKLTMRAGAHMPNAVASLVKETAVPAKLERSTDATAPIRTAAAVTDQMLRKLKKLTKDAETAAIATSQPTQTALLTGSVTIGAADSDSRKIASAPAPASQAKSVSESVPVPVQFRYRQAEFTPQGREAAALLLAYFKAKQFKSVVLSGHADERGSAPANKALSKQRLIRIERLLRDGGFNGGIKLLAMGETQKYSGVDRSKFETEELYQLDRRVEVLSAQ